MVSSNRQIKVGLYVDSQNLGSDQRERQSVITQTLAEWPRNLLAPDLISLYVDGDTNIWQSIWENIVNEFRDSLPAMATVNLPDPKIKPAHQYSHNPSKNAGDITLVLDALDDVHQGMVDFVAVLSNDSDFAGLLYKLQEVQGRDSTGRFGTHGRGTSPFLLITHGNSGRSNQLDNLPATNLHKLSNDQKRDAAITSLSSSQVQSLDRAAGSASVDSGDAVADQISNRISDEPTPLQMAAEVALKMYKTTFNGIEAYNIIKGRWPEHPELSYDVEIAPDRYSISAWFFERIWEPVMQDYGVTVDKEASPRLYTMLHEGRTQLQKFAVSG